MRGRFSYIVFFFFQAEDGIRYLTVTGVQTCALPISGHALTRTPNKIFAEEHDLGVPNGIIELIADVARKGGGGVQAKSQIFCIETRKIGRASCRERV